MPSKYTTPSTQLMRTNSATKIQTRVRGRQARTKTDQRHRTAHGLKRTNSATKIQSRVRGRQARARGGHPRSSNVSEDREENNNDPQLQQLRDRVKELQQTYRAHREAGEKGKMQLALLEYDIAREELLRARSYRDNIHQKNKDRECHGRIACVCLPCLMCF